MMKQIVLPMACFAALISSSQAVLVISQYYEGTNSNKWIEILNTDPVNAVDLTGGNFRLGIWSNGAAEGYKSNVAPSFSMALNGTLAGGAILLIANSASITPSYAIANQGSGSINFNGNDSIALYSGAVFATPNVVDAIGFTELGNEGADVSFVRLSSVAGWNVTSGTHAQDFPQVWQQITDATADNAAASTEARIGYSTVPEPATSSLLVAAAGLWAGLSNRRHRSKCTV